MMDNICQWYQQASMEHCYFADCLGWYDETHSQIKATDLKACPSCGNKIQIDWLDDARNN